MAGINIFRRRKELADAQSKPPEGLDNEVGVAGQLVFTGFQNEERRTDRVTIDQYRKMVDSDDTAQSLYLILTLPILATKFHINADDDDTGEVQAELVRENLLSPPHKGGMDIPMDLILAQMLLATIEGFQLFERVYTLNKDGYVVYKKLAHRDSVGLFLKRDDHGGYAGARQYVTYNGKLYDVTFKPEQTFLFTFDKARNFLYGRSAFKAAYTNYDRKRRLEYLDGISLQNDAIKPKVIQRTASGSLGKVGKTLKNKALAAIAKLGEFKPVASLPYGWELKELNSEGRDPGASIERQNAGMARSLLAQFTMMGTQGKSSVGSYALSANHSDLFMIALKGLMENIENHINFYLIPDLVDMNFAEAHYPEFHFDDLTSDAQDTIKQAFLKLIDKDKASDEVIEGIMRSIANKLDIDVDKIRKDLAKAAAKAEKEKQKNQDGNPPTPPIPPTPPVPPVPPVPGQPNNPVNPADPNNPGNPGGGKGGNLADVSSRDFPGLYEALGVNQDNLGCIMLNLQPFDVSQYVTGAVADLYIDPADPTTAKPCAEVDPHVTLLFGLLQNGNTIRSQVDQLLAGWHCDSVVIEGVDSFPVPVDAPAVPIVARIATWNSPVMEGHDRLTLLPHVNTFSTYQPHITLAWVKNDPAIVQKWVKALGTALGGMRITATGINYGDLPGDDGGAAGSGGGFLEEHEDLADTMPADYGSTKWSRQFTLAEKSVDFELTQKKLNGFEQQFESAIQPIYDKIKADAIQTIAPLLEAKDVNALNDFQLKYGNDYRDAIVGVMRDAYEFAKTSSADELKAPSPATKRDTTAILNQHAQSVADKQLSDLTFSVKTEVLKALRTNNLAEYDLSVGNVLSAIGGIFSSFFDSKVSLTGAIVITQAVNRARDDVFGTQRNQIACYQYSAILDHKTCPICSALDNNVVDYATYRATNFKPPIHAWCRCIWVAIKKDQAEIPEITGLPDAPGGATEPLI